MPRCSSPRYEAEPARIGLDADESFVPQAVGPGFPAQAHRGDVEAGLATAPKRIEATYETSAQYHNALEPHAIVAAWEGDTLSIDTPSQGMAMAQARIAGLFGIAPENIHIRSPFLGGGFGSKGLISGTADPRRHGGAPGRESPSSWCSAASRCSVRWDTGLRRGKPCGSAPPPTAR